MHQERDMDVQRLPPHPSHLQHLRATNAAGWICLSATGAATIAGIWLSVMPLGVWWFLGQLLLATTLVQWFIVLHECGHKTLFRAPLLNEVAGHLAGFFALIPFETWKRVHNRHHKWTGWQDVDPTTARLSVAPTGRLARGLVNVCWKYWIPLFSVLYRLNNFWNISRLLALFRTKTVRRRLVVNTAALAVSYLALAAIVGPAVFARVLGCATVLALMAEDLLLISQHTHVPMGLSQGKDVIPHPAIDQEQFTRSLRFPAWLSPLLLHFDAHELHHMYPFVPGYRLSAIPYSPANEVSCWRWIPAARRVPGEVLLFQNRHQSGYDV
jgi:acyl-lipid omega-6 desaturase (Delta-12 desaturase)